MTPSTISRGRCWAVLLAGGQGERLWPWSRQACPKQFLRLEGGRSLLQLGYARLTHLVARDHIYVIGNAAHAALIRRQLPTLPRRRLIAEPIGRNTAAAVGVGAFLIGREDPGAVMFVATADHLIHPIGPWLRCLQAAAAVALLDVDRLVCIGIPPTGPATGYGYLVPSRRRQRVGRRLWAAPVVRYVEKPSRAAARRLIAQGAFWNSGMFIWTIPAIARALQHCLPQLTRGVVRTIRAEPGTPAFTAQLRRLYATLPSISIDYGVMEHAPDCWMVPAAFRWDDVGSWVSVWRSMRRDGRGNAVCGAHVGLGTSRTLVFGEPGRLIGTIGVRDLVIVQQGDVTLVAHREQAQRVRDLVTRCQRDPSRRRYL